MAEFNGRIPQKPDGNPLSQRDFLKDIGIIATAAVLELYLRACRWRLQTPTPTPSAAPEPIKTSSPLPDATPTFQPNPDVNIDTSLPSPYSGFYFGQEKATPGTIFVGAIKGASFEANNRGYLIPQFDGVHESRLNYLYSQDSPDQTAGFLIDSSYLMQVFKATDSKGGVIGTLPDGTAVEYKNGLWEATVDGKIKFFNPLFANQKGKPFGYPVLADDNQGNLYTGICFDENGVLVTGTKMETAFKTASQIAWEAGYSGDLAKVASVSLNDWGNIVVYDSLGNQISVQPYLNSKAPAESFATATATEVPLPSEFLNQFDGTAYSFKDNQVLFSPDGTNQVAIASIEAGKFVFSVNGQEVSVDPKLATVPEAKWFLNGNSQIMIVNDESGAYWKYEWNQQTNQWVEKNLPEVSTDFNKPTKIEWNDIVSGRWAAAVRQEIEAGKIPTFDDKVVVNSVEFNDFYYGRHGIASLTFSDAERIYLTNPETRPIKYTDGSATFGEIMLGGQSGLIITEQIANKSSGFTLLSLVASPENEFLLKFFFDPYEIKHRALVPIVKVKSPEHLIHYWNIDYGDYYTWFAENDSGFIQAAYDEWLASGDAPQVLEKVLFTASGVTW